MNILFVILCVLFLVSALLFAFWEDLPDSLFLRLKAGNVKCKKNSTGRESGSIPQNIVDLSLEKMSKSESSKDQAKIFIQLILMGNVLIHTLINEGNKYDDKVQNVLFQQFLTPRSIERLDALEGKEWRV